MAVLRMKMFPSKVLILLTFSAITCYAKVEGSAENNALSPAEKTSNNSASPAPAVAAAASIAEKSPYVPSFQTTIWPADLSWKNGVGQAIIVGGAAVISFFLIGGLTLFLAPALGYRMCNLFGNCEPVVTAYSGGNLQSAAGQPNAAYSDIYNAYLPATAYAGYQKRSLDYVGPILKTLASAYEKYERHVTKKD